MTNTEKDFQSLDFTRPSIDSLSTSDTESFTNKGYYKSKNGSQQPNSELKWYERVFITADNTYLKVLALTFFTTGFKIFTDLCVMDLFKEYLKLQPAEMQFLTSLINFPWTMKVVYGFISDNVPIYKSRRRSYVSINGILQCIFLIPLIPDFFTNKYVVTAFLMMYCMAVSFNESVIEALMVMQARNDPVNGSQDINSFGWLFLGVGGIIGSISGGFLTQYVNPRISFAICCVLGLMISIFGYKMSERVELDARGNMPQRGSWKNVNKNLKQMKESLQTPQIYRTLLYFILTGCLVPSFQDVNYYFQLNVLQFSKLTYSLLTLSSFVSLLFGTMIYNKYLQAFEYRSLLQISQLFSLLGASLNLLLVLRINISFGISDQVWVFINAVFSETLSLAFSFLPSLILFMKITPNKVEATIFATLTGALNFSSGVGGPLLGSFFTRYFEVDSQHLFRFYKLIIVQIIAILFSFGYIYLVPTRSEIMHQQQLQIDKQDNEEQEMEIE